MTRDALDAMMRDYALRFEPTAQQAARVVAAVLEHLPDQPRPHRPRPSGLVFRLGVVLSVSRVAVPMAAAAVLGIIVGRGLDDALTPVRFAEMLTTSSGYLLSSSYMAGL